MGILESNDDQSNISKELGQMKKEDMVIGNNYAIKLEGQFNTHASPGTLEEIQDLYENKSAICKINFENLKDGKKVTGFGTGFFCALDDKDIPFSKALFTNNHILNENIIQINKQIEYEYCGNKNTITITKNRKVFTNEELDYTCIEILEIDNINNFFNIDKSFFNDINSLINKEIFILQYPKGNLSFDKGKILNIKNNKIMHSVSTGTGSSGSPLIKRYNNKYVIGIHRGAKLKKKAKESLQKKEKENENDEIKFNLATPFDVIIKDIISQSARNKSMASTYKNNLIYNKDNKHRLIGDNLKYNNNNPSNVNSIFDENKFITNSRNSNSNNNNILNFKISNNSKKNKIKSESHQTFFKLYRCDRAIGKAGGFCGINKNN